MRRLAILRAGFLASVSALALLAGCATGAGYRICDDTANAAACPDNTANVVIVNE